MFDWEELEVRILRWNHIGLICSILLLLISLMTLITLGFAEDLKASTGNETANATADAAAISEVVSAGESLSLQGIWKVSLAGSEITLAVNQSGDSLFGQAKFEGEEPWNGVIAGSLSGRAVHIAMAALQGNVLVSTQLSGTALDDSIEGSYVRSNSDGNAAKGEFTASRISPVTSEFTPAQIKNPAKATSEEVKDQTEMDQQPETEVEPAIQARKSAFIDVKDLAKGIDPNIMPRHAPL
jgi:hypothetical protein